MLRAQLIVCLVLVGQVGAEPALRVSDYAAPQADEVRVIRDRYGVPHVISNDLAALFYGLGYAMAEDQLERLALNYLAANGRSAEVLGPDELQKDILVRSLKLPQLAKKGYRALAPERKAMVDAFAAGINRVIAKDGAQHPAWIAAVSPEDCVAFSLYVNSMFAVEHCLGDLQRNGIKLSATAAPEIDRLWGSNQFAVSPERSATGSCLLSMDPHLPHTDFFRWYEMHLVGPEINAMGASLIGLPFIGMGRTEETAWCMTVNSPDLGDVFQLELDPKQPTKYKSAEGWLPFEMRQETVRIRTDAGLVDRKVPVLSSKFGPVLAKNDTHAFAIRLATPDGNTAVEQGYRMMVATNLKQFKKALGMQGMLMFNILYADKHGDIFYVSNGRVGKRSSKIKSHQLRPASEAWADWDGIHAFNELPQVSNPSSGYLLNTNSGPQNVTVGDAPKVEAYPPYMIGHQANSRSRRLSSLLAADESVTWEEMLTYATDTRLEVDSTLDSYFKLVEPIQEQLEESQRKLLASVVEVLQKWDRRADLKSRGAVLFYQLLSDDELSAAVRSGDRLVVQQKTAEVGTKVKSRFGALDVPWSEFSRIRRGQIEQGVAGWVARGPVGSTLRPVGGVERGGKHYCLGGSSYGMIVDFSGKTRSVSCLPFGVSEDPSSPHFADMLPLFCQRKFKPTWFRPEELKQNTESKLKLVYERP